MSFPDPHIVRFPRQQPIQLPVDPQEATAAVLSFIQQGGSTSDKSSALEAARERAKELLKPDRSGLREELASHAIILNALFLRWSAESVAAKDLESKARYGKLAIHAQTAALRCLSAVEALNPPQQQRQPLPE